MKRFGLAILAILGTLAVLEAGLRLAPAWIIAPTICAKLRERGWPPGPQKAGQ